MEEEEEEEEVARERGEKVRVESEVKEGEVTPPALGVEGEISAPSCHPLSWLASHFCRRAFLSSAGVVMEAGEDTEGMREGDSGLGERTGPPPLLLLLLLLLTMTLMLAPRWGGERGVRVTPGEGGGRNPPPPRGDRVSYRERPPERYGLTLTPLLLVLLAVLAVVVVSGATTTTTTAASADAALPVGVDDTPSAWGGVKG